MKTAVKKVLTKVALNSKNMEFAKIILSGFLRDYKKSVKFFCGNKFDFLSEIFMLIVLLKYSYLRQFVSDKNTHFSDFENF